MFSYLKGYGVGVWCLVGYKVVLDNYNIFIVLEYIEEYGYDEEFNILDMVICRLFIKISVWFIVIFCVNDMFVVLVYCIVS